MDPIRWNQRKTCDDFVIKPTFEEYTNCIELLFNDGMIGVGVSLERSKYDL